MPGTYTNLLYHIVFSTKGRRPWIAPALQGRVHEYMAGLVRNSGGITHAIGGMPDHVHLLIRWRPDESLSDLMRNLKAHTSRWIHETFPELRDFAWQEGYAAFTVSRSRGPAVERYIRNQAEHHRVKTFEEELVEFLDQQGVKYEVRFLWD